MASEDAEIVVLGVDPNDPRAAAELSRWIPADATAIYRTPGIDHSPAPGLSGRQYPPGSLLAMTRGADSRSDSDGIASTIDSVAAERDLPQHELAIASPPGSAERSEWWTAGAWTVAVFPVVIAIAAVALVVTEDSLLRWAFAVLITIASVALLVGFHYAHAAAAIHRADPEIAATAARAIADGGDDSSDNSDDQSARAHDQSASAKRPVVIVPERNAAGVAAELRDRSVRAEARIVTPHRDPSDASDRSD